MLITVSGTQCIGKSTLIKDFLKEFNNFKTPNIDYRKIITENNLKLNREGDYRSQKILFDFVLKQTIECSKLSENYIMDRSLIDVYAYSSWLYLNKPDSGFNEVNIKEMYDTLQEYVILYDKIFYIPLQYNTHIKIEDDKFRDTNEEYRLNIDKLFDLIILDLSYENICANNVYNIYGTREERINLIKDILI